jgi:hypothetical protein
MSTAPPPGPDPESRERFDLGPRERSGRRRGAHRIQSQAALVLALIVIVGLVALILL